jgi:peptidoglycan hydrolase-like protein with peptidoglycan-binding domain
MPAHAHRHPPRRSQTPTVQPTQSIDGAGRGNAFTAQLLAQASQGSSGLSSVVGVVSLGAHGESVRAIQRAVGVSDDGDFGPATRAAVQAFQRKNGLSVDGMVGPQTLSALKRAPQTVSAPQTTTPAPDTAPPGELLGSYDAYRSGAYLGKKEVYEVDGVRMTASTARAWKRMKTAAEADGVRLRLNSGFRTMGEQQSLYNAYQNGTGNLAAYPGYSNHQNGVALDIDVVSDAAYDWIHANGNRFGFKRTVASEPWHWEYLG